MLNWLRNWWGQRNFNAAWKNAAKQKLEEGVISYDKYEECMRAASNPEVMRRARNQLKTEPGMLGGISDWDWEAIKQWFIDYFIPAMKVILPLVIMLLGPANPSDED